MKRKLTVFLLVLTMGILTACGMTEEDAKDYVKASLDAAYKGEFEAFVEITDSTIEGAEAMYEENIVHIMEAAGFSDMNLDDELTENYKQLFLDLIKKTDYTIGDAVKKEDGGFAVDVAVTPLTVLNGVEEELTDVLLERIADMDDYPSDEKIVEMTFEEMYDLLCEKVENPEYSEEEIIIQINLYKNENGKYAISEEDMLTLDGALFVTD